MQICVASAARRIILIEIAIRKKRFLIPWTRCRMRHIHQLLFPSVRHLQLTEENVSSSRSWLILLDRRYSKNTNVLYDFHDPWLPSGDRSVCSSASIAGVCEQLIRKREQHDLLSWCRVQVWSDTSCWSDGGRTHPWTNGFYSQVKLPGILWV